jgi:hypothetical protein
MTNEQIDALREAKETLQRIVFKIGRESGSFYDNWTEGELSEITHDLSRETLWVHNGNGGIGSRLLNIKDLDNLNLEINNIKQQISDIQVQLQNISFDAVIVTSGSANDLISTSKRYFCVDGLVSDLPTTSENVQWFLSNNKAGEIVVQSAISPTKNKIFMRSSPNSGSTWTDWVNMSSDISMRVDGTNLYIRNDGGEA